MSGERDPVSIGDNGDGTLSVAGYDATRQQAWERVTAQTAGAFMTPTTAAGWRGVDSTYLVCGQDRSTSVELPTGHHPFVTRPDLMVDQLQALLPRA